MIAATEPGLYISPLPNSTPVWVCTQDRPDPGCMLQSADTPWSYLVQSRETRVIFHDDLKQTQLSQPQKLWKDVSLPRTHKLEHTLVPPPDSCTGKGEM